MTVPTIPLDVDVVHSPNRLHLGIVFAWMVFPDDENMRARTIKTATIEHMIEVLGTGVPFRGAEIPKLLCEALQAPAPQDLLEQSVNQFDRGFAAGMLLYNTCLRARRGEQAPMTRTMKEIEKPLFRRKNVSGSTCDSASKHVNDVVWKTYRPVAALWAALIILMEKGEPTELPCNRADLPTLLWLSERIRETAEQTFPPRRKDPVLRPGESVRLPEELAAALPAGHWEVRLSTVPIEIGKDSP